MYKFAEFSQTVLSASLQTGWENFVFHLRKITIEDRLLDFHYKTTHFVQILYIKKICTLHDKLAAAERVNVKILQFQKYSSYMYQSPQQKKL